MEQLQQTQADPAERHRMLQILKRIHEQELEERAQLREPDADSDDGSRVLAAQARSQAERLQSGAGEEEGEGEGEGEDLEVSAALAEKLRLQVRFLSEGSHSRMLVRAAVQSAATREAPAGGTLTRWRQWYSILGAGTIVAHT